MKNKTVFLSRLWVRAEAPDGGDVPSDEVFCDFQISDAELDSHYSRMSESSLANFAENARSGVPFCLNHQTDVGKVIGRTVSADYDAENRVVRATVAMLRDTEETPSEQKVNEFIRRIERGYLNSVSVGYRDSQEICALDGKEIWDWSCEDPCVHVPGRMYDGEQCTYEVRDAKLREVSLVATPSNPNAKLIERREWSAELQAIKGIALPEKEKGLSLLEREGRKYREGLIEVALKAGVRAIDGFDREVWRERLNGMDSDYIGEQTGFWNEIGDRRWSGGRQTRMTSEGSDGFELPIGVYQ